MIQPTRVLTTTTAIREVVCKSSFASNAAFTRGTSVLEDIYSDVDTPRWSISAVEDELRAAYSKNSIAVLQLFGE